MADIKLQKNEPYSKHSQHLNACTILLRINTTHLLEQMSLQSSDINAPVTSNP